MLSETSQSVYKVGQVWSYKTRPGEEQSSLTVVKIESHPALGNIIHISLQGLKMKNPQAEKGFTDTITHLPVSEEAIAQSVVTLLNEKANLPEYQEGYQNWRSAFDSQNAGIWSITVSECVDAIEQVIS